MATFLHRLAAFVVRRRWYALIAWLVILGVVGAGAMLFKGTMTNSFTIPGTASQQALDQLREKIPAAGGATGRVVFAAPEGKQITDYSQQMSATMQEIAALGPERGVVAAVDPMTTKSISPDGRVAIGQVAFSGQLSEIDESTQDAIAAIADAHATDGSADRTRRGSGQTDPGHRLHRGHRCGRRADRPADHLRLAGRRRNDDADRADRGGHRSVRHSVGLRRHPDVLDRADPGVDAGPGRRHRLRVVHRLPAPSPAGGGTATSTSRSRVRSAPPARRSRSPAPPCSSRWPGCPWSAFRS